MVTYVFDGSFEGLLTAVFDFYELKPGKVSLVWDKVYQPSLIENTHTVVTDGSKAERVWLGLQKKLSANWLRTFYCTYLSEEPQAFCALFNFAVYIFDNPAGAEANFGNEFVLAVSQTERRVSRERHRMKAFIRFQKTADGIYYAPIEPDFNVLPLISSFFKNRYADQRWIIYDVRRQYGLFYDLETVQQISYDFVSAIDTSSVKLPKGLTDEKEELAAVLWKDYFDSTNIKERKNMKLHIRHVPKRYWRYLGEKEGKN